MNKKILIAIGILILLISSVFILIKFSERSKFGECKIDTDCNLVRCVGVYCDNGKCVCPIGESKKLSDVKVVSFYQTITDGDMIGRSIEDVTDIFKETKTDMVFRSFWRWNPVPESPDVTVPSEFPVEYMKEAAKRGYTYRQLRDATGKIKAELPGILVVGAITAQRINRIDWNPVSGNIFEQKETWEMAFNPEKWNLDVSKKEAQCKLTKSWHWTDPNLKCLDDYDPKKSNAYFPDITNKEYQKLLLSWAEKQIDCGADAIWIDMLFYQANLIEKSYPGHIAVKESFDASSKIVDEIHKYGKSKDKQIYVGTWYTFAEFYYFPPNIDFVTASPLSEEVLNKEFNLDGWIEFKSDMEEIERKLDKKIPIFAFIDVGNDNLPIAIFSQNLTPDEQREFLKTADEFYSKLDINFVYPVHGGFMGQHAKILSFGISKNYDSLAPEFQTYKTIKELVLKKK